ncbi:hypothetical protein MY4038_010213 [Beauveria bassiana]
MLVVCVEEVSAYRMGHAFEVIAIVAFKPPQTRLVPAECWIVANSSEQPPRQIVGEARVIAEDFHGDKDATACGNSQA